MASPKRTHSDIGDSPPSSSVRCFCCLDLYPMSTPHGIHDEAILQFAIHMTQLACSFNLSSYSGDNTTAFVKDAVYLIKYQKFLYGEISGTRYFMPLPTEQKFIEIEEGLVVRSLEKEKWGWRYSMRHLKLRCNRHQGPIFVCRIVQREEIPMEKDVPAIKSIDLEDNIFQSRQ
ncbi:uncharacterized protein K444DRAFT_629523 [Hyaloscypha bicolor E]|uniref:Uncharacterized protein n=1 Tax=Hyaloscypha bicolor E TaxID=1095630 RepID=A0A2J6TAP2_9HELO|nr:uncharacterized protein K444DRAFT_629523 [Hyaloscypha bicolor E]PMD60095.1 hypothetical protein K444DRAFT_629523 [Hyaloscypha bicolor E]